MWYELIYPSLKVDWKTIQEPASGRGEVVLMELGAKGCNVRRNIPIEVRSA